MFMHAAVMLSLSTIGMADADVIRVDIDANPNGDGSTWSLAYDSLTDALLIAGPGDQIWVADGEYVPEIPVGRNATFLIPDGVQLFGGFVGNEQSIDQRGDPLSPAAILSGEFNASNNTYHVVTFAGVGSDTVLDGFTITSGIADGPLTADIRGAGIYSTDSSPRLLNLIVENCLSDGSGAGIYLAGTTAAPVEITDCFIRENAGLLGGGIYTRVETIISNTEFTRNTANDGGAIAIFGSSTYLIDNCLFLENTASATLGGAVLIRLSQNSASSVIELCEFRANTAPLVGAISYTEKGEHRITSSKFYANISSFTGASAVEFNADNLDSILTIENSVFTGNTANANSGTVTGSGDGQFFIIGSTFTQNAASTGVGSGAILVLQGEMTVDNCILWNNSGPISGQEDSIYYAPSATLLVNRTIVQGLRPFTFGPPGVDNIDANPLFVDANGLDNIPGTPDDNVRLGEGSPAIDRGSDLVVGINVIADIYGDARFLNDFGTPNTGVDDGIPGIVDLGAAEFQGTTPPACPPDLNYDGSLNFFDISAFLTAFNIQNPIADFNDDGSFNFFDISAFLTAFSAGCP